ncbi:hypothetical protein FACS1894125_1980 [Actinomycetota bacterium]|nr:hypothetical protein FACS1894125_1980 [Actinomycetota bacterium]
MKLDLIYEDDDIVVVDKPSGVITHQANSFKGDDIYHLLVGQGVQIKTSGDDFRQGIISRLDIGTTGVLIVAKNEHSYISLKQQFSNHSVEKKYTALAVGKLKQHQALIDAPIGRHPTKRALFAVVDDGKPAKTQYKILQEFERTTLVEVALLTGRTHQIRVHFQAIGHPLYADPLYGTQIEQLGRPFLHSSSLTVVHPTTNSKMTFTSELPLKLRVALDMQK